MEIEILKGTKKKTPIFFFFNFIFTLNVYKNKKKIIGTS